MRVAVSVLFISSVGARSTCANDAKPSPYADTLRRHGIEADAAGLRHYLRQLHPGEQQRREVQRLIEQLGSERFADRELAMKRLAALPIPPVEALQIAAESDDPEVRFRARQVLTVVQSRGSVRPVVMHAVFKLIEQEQIRGLTAELLRAVEQCDQRHLRLAVRAAVRATATPEDASLLREAARDDNKEVALAAVSGLAALESTGRDELRRLLEHKSEEVSLAAARALIDQSDRTALGPLVKLLEAESMEVRIGAVQTLRQVSRTQRNYAAYEDASVRKEAIDKWAAWVAGEGLTAKLHLPLKPVRLELGRRLIAIAPQHKVIELDADGSLVWEKSGLRNPWGCVGLANGHRLISSRDGRFVVEYDAGGVEVWRKDGLPEGPINVQRLENGNTLVAFFVGQKVMEIRPDGTTAWQISINGGPVDVRKLTNDRMLVTLHQPGGSVVEVDRAGKVHWQIEGLKLPMTAQRLENGNTLIAEYDAHRVAEWDRDGKIVWQPGGLQYPYSAERLSNGNTLIAHRTDVREVDRQRRVVWQKHLTNVRHATRY